MKTVCLFLALAACEATFLQRAHQTPDQVAAENIKLDEDFKAKDSFGNTELTPACAKIVCGEYSCPTPFELKVDKTCCGYCYAPDDVVGVDRHVKVPYNSSGMVVEQCPSAPSTCSGPGVHPVRCFKPTCRVGDTATCGANACCPKCTGAGGGVRIDQGMALPTAAPEKGTPPPMPDMPAAEEAAPEPEPPAPEPEPATAAPEPEPVPEPPAPEPEPVPKPPAPEEPAAPREDSGSIKIRTFSNGKKQMSKDGGETWETMNFQQLESLVGPARAFALLAES